MIEHRRLKKAAAAWARGVKPGRTYYVVDTLASGPDRGAKVVTEVRFARKPLVGLMAGGLSPEALWLRYGGAVYDDRGHQEIRHLPTTSEMAEHAAKIGARLLNSPGWEERVRQAATGTAFRTTW